MQSSLILGVTIHTCNYDEVIEKVKKHINDKKRFWITTPNPEIVLRAHYNPDYARIINAADMAIPDGIGIVVADAYTRAHKKGITRYLYWGYLLVKTVITGHPGGTTMIQVSGDQLVHQLLPVAQEFDWKIVLVGGRTDTSLRAKLNLQKKYPTLRIETHQGHKQYAQRSQAEDRTVLDFLTKSNADIVLVGYGAPHQELFIHDQLSTSTSVLIGVGGTLDELAGNVTTTPSYIRDHGLRWLWRLITQPHRLGRIWNATIRFSAAVLNEK